VPSRVALSAASCFPNRHAVAGAPSPRLSLSPGSWLPFVCSLDAMSGSVMDKVDRASRARFVISTPFGWEFQLEYDESLTIAALQEFLPLLLSLGGGNSFSSWYGRENCSVS